MDLGARTQRSAEPESKLNLLKLMKEKQSSLEPKNGLTTGLEQRAKRNYRKAQVDNLLMLLFKRKRLRKQKSLQLRLRILVEQVEAQTPT